MQALLGREGLEAEIISDIGIETHQVRTSRRSYLGSLGGGTWLRALFIDCDTLDYCEYCRSPDSRVGTLKLWQHDGPDPVYLLSAGSRNSSNTCSPCSEPARTSTFPVPVVAMETVREKAQSIKTKPRRFAAPGLLFSPPSLNGLTNVAKHYQRRIGISLRLWINVFDLRSIENVEMCTPLNQPLR
jgi:hypothetical protein